MAHEYGKVLRGVELPDKFGIVTGRVHNWLSEKSDDIEPVSCWVLSVNEPTKYNEFDICNLFKLLAWKLQANAGVNVVLNGIEKILQGIESVQYLQKTRQIKTGNVIIVKNQQQLDAVQFYNSDATVYKVADSLRLESKSSHVKFPNHISIYDSWLVVWTALTTGSQVILDFSDVRETDDYSSGKDSFISLLKEIIELFYKPTLKQFLFVLSSINGTIKRGGFRKHGAVTTTLSNTSKLFDQYIDIPFADLPFVKKSVEFTVKPTYAQVQKFLEKYNAGELFAEKNLGINGKGKQLHSNVCRGIALEPEDQCLIGHINAGMVTEFADIIRAFEEITNFVVKVFNLQQELGFNNVDRQIAIGIVGLANLLRTFNISYQKFVDALIFYTDAVVFNQGVYNIKQTSLEKELILIDNLYVGMLKSAIIAENNNMRACLTIEPSESCARRYKDWQGYALCPNIDPPDVVPGVGIERRHSQTGIKDENGNEIIPVFNYGADIQTANELSDEYHFELWNRIQMLMDLTGKAHMSSYEHWGKPLDYLGFCKWWESSLKTLYYYRKVGTKHLTKSQTVTTVRANYDKIMNENNQNCNIENGVCESCSD